MSKDQNTSYDRKTEASVSSIHRSSACWRTLLVWQFQRERQTVTFVKSKVTAKLSIAERILPQRCHRDNLILDIVHFGKLKDIPECTKTVSTDICTHFVHHGQTECSENEERRDNLQTACWFQTS